MSKQDVYEGEHDFKIVHDSAVNCWVVITEVFRDAWFDGLTLNAFVKEFGDSYRLAWGTRWSRWVAIDKHDRDWDHGVTIEAFRDLGHDACLGYYLVCRRIGGAA